MMMSKPQRVSKSDGSLSGLYIFMRRTLLLFSKEALTDFCLSWFCFHSGRPSSLSLKDVAIEYAQDPFVRLLVQLCKTITRSTNEIYGERHESLLHMWRVARSIADDLRSHNTHMQQALGFGLDHPIQPGSVGARQTIFTARE